METRKCCKDNYDEDGDGNDNGNNDSYNDGNDDGDNDGNDGLIRSLLLAKPSMYSATWRLVSAAKITMMTIMQWAQ